MIADYHVHTDNSFDCKTSMDEMCERAIQLGIEEIAFTDHFNNHIFDVDIGYYNADRYFEDIEICRSRFPQITILAGVELGEPHRWYSKIQPLLDHYPFDIVLGSVHWVGRTNMFDRDYYRANTPLAAYTQYFSEVLKMAQHGGFDVLAHVDLPKRASFEIYGEFDPGAYEDLIRPVWQACIDNNIVLEINTKALRLPVNQLHPTTEALCWYAEMGGQNITIGSDSHHADSLASNFPLAMKSALDAGIAQTCRYKHRQIVK